MFSPSVCGVQCVFTRCLTGSRIESTAEVWVLPPRCGVESGPVEAPMCPAALGRVRVPTSSRWGDASAWSGGCRGMEGVLRGGTIKKMSENILNTSNVQHHLVGFCNFTKHCLLCSPRLHLLHQKYSKKSHFEILQYKIAFMFKCILKYNFFI